MLLTENRFIKYLIYAIGEIILVVIGILIALYFNNQNEKRKDLTNEIEMLVNLNRDLDKNLEELSWTYDFTKKRYQFSSKALSYLEENKQLDDSFKVALEWLNIYDMNNIWSTTYKYIESQGAASMHNNSLRLKITEMYDRHFYNVTYRENLDLKRVDQFLKPELYKLIQMWPSQMTVDSASNSNK